MRPIRRGLGALAAIVLVRQVGDLAAVQRRSILLVLEGHAAQFARGAICLRQMRLAPAHTS